MVAAPLPQSHPTLGRITFVVGLLCPLSIRGGEFWARLGLSSSTEPWHAFPSGNRIATAMCDPMKWKNMVARIAALVVIAMLLAPVAVRAQDLEAEAWPEFDIWIKLDETGKNRLFILAYRNSMTR